MAAGTHNAGIEARNLRLLGRHTLDGHGDTMHVNVQDGFAYIGHMGGDQIGTSILDVSDPAKPRLAAQIERPPGTHSHTPPLHQAIAHGELDVVKLLIERGSPANARQHGGWTALHAAANDDPIDDVG